MSYWSAVRQGYVVSNETDHPRPLTGCALYRDVAMNDESDDHYEALEREAAHRLADTLAPYGVLTRERLAKLSGGSRWNTVGFEQALRWAVDHDYLRRLDDDLYEIGPEANRDDATRVVVEGGW
jgi:hypothetical protein